MSDFTTSTTYTGLPQDTRWRASKHGQDSARPVQLDASKFTGDAIATYDLNGVPTTVIKSGVAIGYTTAAPGIAVPWDPTKTDGSEELAGFLNDNEGVVIRTADKATAKPVGALLIHGVIDVTHLPVATQKASIQGERPESTGAFSYVAA